MGYYPLIVLRQLDLTRVATLWLISCRERVLKSEVALKG
jgi:hypothetical protein